MKIKSLFTGVALFTSSILSAQSYTVTPTNTDTVDAPFNTLTIFDIYQQNTGSTYLLLKWQKISVNLPSGWDYSLCDYASCYTGIPNGGTMDTVDVGDMGFLGLNINPYSIAGQGIVKLYVYEDGFFNGGDTITWVVNATVNGVDETSFENSVNVYPNPVNDVLKIKSERALKSVLIMDASGKLILEGSATAEINLQNLNAGVYFLSVIGNDGTVIRKKFIKQ
jgi:hypothetical protein